MDVFEPMLQNLPLQAGEFFLFTGVCLIVVVLLFVIGLLLAIWVYKDAERRGMSGVLWLIVVLIAGIIGLIIYLVVRKGKK